jgi:predicted PurR-regulated permease PerM
MTYTDSDKWIWGLLVALGVAGGGFLLYLLSPILTPFFAAALLAYLGDPLADQLEKKMSRTLAVSIVFLVIFLVLTIFVLLVFPMLTQQLAYLIGKMPEYLDGLQKNVVPLLSEKLGVEGELIDLQLIKKLFTTHYQQAGGLVSQLAQSVAASGMALMAFLANLVLIPVVTFYLLRDWDYLVQRVDGLLPRKTRPVIVKLARESDEVLAAFLRGQMMVMLCLGVVYASGLWLVGLDLALLIGMLAGLVSFVPYLGFIVGIMAAGIAVLLQTQELFMLLPVLLVFAVGQALEGMLLTPLLVGDRIGLHPVAVIFAVLAGGQLFGFVGVLLALPVAAVLAVLLRHAHAEYKSSSMFNNAS